MGADGKGWFALVGLGSLLIFGTLALIVGLFRERPDGKDKAFRGQGYVDLEDWW